MKHIFLRLFIISVCMVNSSALLALRPAQRGAIATLIKQLESNKIAPENIWQNIQALNISPNDYNDPEFKRLNTLAVERLNSAKFTLNGKTIPVTTNLASLSVEDKPEQPFKRIGTDKDNDFDDTLISFDNDETDDTQVVLQTKPSNEEQNNLLKAFNELAGIRNNTTKVKTLPILNDLYKTFYEIQDFYAGLSGVPVTEGKFWWKKTVAGSDKTEFAKDAAKTLKLLMEKELELRDGLVTKLTKEEAEALLAEVNANNPIEALRRRTITKDQYKDILDVRGELLKWKKRSENKTISVSDKTAIETAIAKARSLGQYVGEFSKQIANELEKFIKTPANLKQAQLLENLTKTFDDITKNINDLNAKIDTAIQDLSLIGTVTKFDFKNSFQAIDVAIKNLPKGPEKEKLHKMAMGAFANFGSYIGITESTTSSIFSTLRQKWNNYWKTPDNETATAIDKADTVIKELIAEYKFFPLYIYATETDAKTLNANERVGKDQLINIIRNTPEAQRLSVVETLFIELRDNIFKSQKDLTKNKFSNLLNLEYYTNLITAVQTSNLITGNDRQKLDVGWNQLQLMCTEHLINVLDEYNRINDLSHLHLVATGQKVKIAKDINALIPEAPFNAINTMLADLKTYVNNDNKLKTIIVSKITESFCYLLAAFDAFSYALLSNTIKPDVKTGWNNWFWGFFGYDLTANSEADFKQKSSDYVNKYLTKISSAINLYHKNIFNLYSSEEYKNKYNVSSFNILNVLTREQLTAAQLYKDNSTTEYRYDLKMTSPIIIAGGVEVKVIIDDIDSLHKKKNGYDALVRHYRTVVEGAYGSAAWEQEAGKTDVKWGQLDALAKDHDVKAKQIKIMITNLEQQVQNANTIAKITELNKQMEKNKNDYLNVIQDLQEKYQQERLNQGISGIPKAPPLPVRTSSKPQQS